MMDMREFIEFIKEELPDFLPEEVHGDITIDDTVVSKMNDQKLHGIIFKSKDSDAAPTLYVDDLYERHEAGEDIGFLMAELAERFEASRHMPTPPDVDLSWDAVKDRLTVRLLEKDRNVDFISNMPYVDVGNGLVITADINMPGDMDGGWRVAVNHNVLDQLGVDRNELFSNAMSNAKIYDRAVLTDMTQALFSPDKENLLDRDAPLDIEEISAMFVLTTEGSNLGACALYYPDVKEKAAELMGSGFYVLPSSVHEVILVPDTAGHNEKELCDMVKQANRTVVEPQEVLSDSVYHYDKDSRMLSKVDPERDKADRVAEAR